MTVRFILTKAALTFSGIDARPVSVPNDHPKFQKMVDAVKSGTATAEELMDILEEEKRKIEESLRLAAEEEAKEKKKHDGSLSENLSIQDGILRYKDEVLDLYVAKKLMDMIREGFSVKPMVNFIEKLMLNPSRRAVHDLYRFLEHGNMPLTPEGDFIAYKAIREDWKDIHSGTMDNSIGAVVKMSRNRVDENPNNTCSHGLHVCSFSYLPHFAHANGHIVEVAVNPADVVAIPADYNNTKMRVCQYTVLREYEGYYQKGEDRLAATSVYSDKAFIVKVFNNEADEGEIVAAEDSLSKAAAIFEQTEGWRVTLENQTSGKVLEESENPDLWSDDCNDDEDEDFFNNEDNDYCVVTASGTILESGFDTEEEAREYARDVMDNYEEVRVLDSDGDVVATYRVN